MIQAILYLSNTGFTEKYAQLLKKRLNIPAYSMKSSIPLANDSEIIYLGWLKAGFVSGYKKAAKKYKIRAVLGVGIGGDGSQVDNIRNANQIPDEIPVFSAQGGYAPERLKGLWRFILNMKFKSDIKRYEQIPMRTADEDAVLDMMKNGGDYVSEDGLIPLIDWYNSTVSDINA